jgi:L-asparaginase / beta-aspartyl-peptidase
MTYVKISIYIFIVLICFGCSRKATNSKMDKKYFGIVIHGGAGNFKKEDQTIEEAMAYEKALTLAIESGYSILENGGSSIDAVEIAIKSLEDSPLFNAGKGSVYNSKGEIEMDASIMDGKSMDAGAVACVQLVKNPISLARTIMEKSDYILLNNEGALEFAKKYGLPIETPEYFKTELRYKKYLKAKKNDKVELDHEDKMGTVGAVALDKNGNIAAGTSTGGLNYKKFGRIGDSALIGAGTYANNKSCGISCTGLGEYFIKTSAAHNVSSLILYNKMSLKEAIHKVLFEDIVPLGGRGGIIGIDKNGSIVVDKTTSGMYRAYKSSTTPLEVKIFD